MNANTKYDLCVIGGAGRVGLPLSISFARAGLNVAIVDINKKAVEKIKAGQFPFKEENGERELRNVLKKRKLFPHSEPEAVSLSKFVLIVVGTDIDEYLNPNFKDVANVVQSYSPYLRDGQTLILRSTVYPGTSQKVQALLASEGKKIGVSFCPERIVEGKAFEELKSLPQIVSAFDGATLKAVSSLFNKIVDGKIIVLPPKEAELAKLFSNAWRYVKFAVANQFFTIAEDHKLNYRRLYRALVEGYPRNADLPMPGFAAGPCLFKDTMHLVAFCQNQFFLGQAAMWVNEGLPAHIVKNLAREQSALGAGKEFFGKAMAASAEKLLKHPFFVSGAKTKTLGILGMAFKANSDDPRSSLAYKLRKAAFAEFQKVLCSDVFIKDPEFLHWKDLIAKSDVIVLAAPHDEYKKIDPRKYPQKTFVDIWNFWHG